MTVTEHPLAFPKGDQPVCVPSPPLCLGGLEAGAGEGVQEGQSSRNPKTRTEELLSLNINW